MISGVLVGYLMWGGIISLVAALVVGPPVFQRRRDRAEATRLAYEANHQAFQGVVDRLESQQAELEPWTPAEREAFGINDTARFIEETERILYADEMARKPPLERAMARSHNEIRAAATVPGPILGRATWIPDDDPNDGWRRDTAGRWIQE